MDAQFQIQDSLLTVTGSLDLYAAEGFRDSLQQIVEQAGEPALNLAGVESCDLACLQLLRAAAQAAPLRLLESGTAVPEACRQLGSSLDELMQGGR